MIKYTKGRVVVSVDMESKNSHRFQDGTTIRLERNYNNFNRRETQPVNATVISAEHIPEGSRILIHHNALHEVNRIYNYSKLSEEEASDVKYFSIPETECFAWMDADGRPNPMPGFVFAVRVYEPYQGVLHGIDPTLVKDVLYIKTGDLAGNICHVLKAADYEIIYQGFDGREAREIRVRHSDTEELEREEVTCINHSLTDKLNNGKLLVGLSPETAKPINAYVY